MSPHPPASRLSRDVLCVPGTSHQVPVWPRELLHLPELAGQAGLLRSEHVYEGEVLLHTLTGMDFTLLGRVLLGGVEVHARCDLAGLDDGWRVTTTRRQFGRDLVALAAPALRAMSPGAVDPRAVDRAWLGTYGLGERKVLGV